ncbi:MAG: hypothetical protein OXH41_13005 [Chloroflexi bacterium]|nr:hypothetical protein [Chloroflexota bacterium]
MAQALEAAGAVDDQELKRIAFEHVLDHLLGNGEGQPTAQAPSASDTTQIPTPAPHPVDSSLATEQQRVDAAARYFDIDPSQVRELFDLSRDEPKLVMPSKKLAKGKATAVREITLLVCGVRTAVGLETGAQHIRTAADDFNRLDSANFMTTISAMDQIAVLGKPGSPNRAVRMRVTGAEEARPLAQKLVT